MTVEYSVSSRSRGGVLERKDRQLDPVAVLDQPSLSGREPIRLKRASARMKRAGIGSGADKGNKRSVRTCSQRAVSISEKNAQPSGDRTAVHVIDGQRYTLVRERRT